MNKIAMLVLLGVTYSGCASLGGGPPRERYSDRAKQVTGGMTQPEVQTLLGEPLEIDMSDGIERWRYAWSSGGAFASKTYFRVEFKEAKVVGYGRDVEAQAEQQARNSRSAAAIEGDSLLSPKSKKPVRCTSTRNLMGGFNSECR